MGSGSEDCRQCSYHDSCYNWQLIGCHRRRKKQADADDDKLLPSEPGNQ